MSGRKPQRIQWERNEQEALIEWIGLQYPKELLFCIPNQLIRSCAQARNMARSGLVSGIPDLMLAKAVKPYHGLFIELKRPKKPGCQNAIVSKSQKAILLHLLSRGYLCEVCFGFDEAKIVIENYLGK